MTPTDLLMQFVLSNIDDELMKNKSDACRRNADLLGRTMAAISNSARKADCPCGWMAIGVNDDRTVGGTSFLSTVEEKQWFDAFMLQNSSGSFRIGSINEVEYHGKRVVLIEIQAASKMATWKGETMDLNGDNTVNLGKLNSAEAYLEFQSIVKKFKAQALTGANRKYVSFDFKKLSAPSSQKSALVSAVEKSGPSARDKQALAQFFASDEVCNTFINDIAGKSTTDEVAKSVVHQVKYGYIEDRIVVKANFIECLLPFLSGSLKVPAIRKQINTRLESLGIKTVVSRKRKPKSDTK